MQQASREDFTAFVWDDERAFLSTFMHRFPESVVDRYLVNTSFDSGCLTLSDEERQEGWSQVGALTHSPRIRSLDQVPHDCYDEWLVFEEPVSLGRIPAMVNYSGFSPIDFSWAEELEKFWENVLRLRPVHVLGEGDLLYCVTRDVELARKLSTVSDWF